MVRKDGGTVPPSASIAGLDDIRLVGDAVLTIGSVPGHRGTYRLVVSDAKTGAVRWSATRDDRVGGGGGARYGFLKTARVVGDPAGDWTIVTMFERPLGASTVEDGIMGLSGKDGRLKWRIPVQRVRRCSCPWTRATFATLGPASATTVAVEIRTQTTGGQGITDQATRTVAYDIATRRQARSVPGVSPAAIEGDLLLVQQPKLPAKTADTAATTLSALDLRTGRPRWNLAGRYPHSRLTQAVADTLIVDRDDLTALVDTATGRELATSPAQLSGCARTPAVFACRDSRAAGDDDQAVTIDRSGDTATIARVAGSRWCSRIQVWQELLYCDDASDQPQYSAAIDQTGRIATARLPGRLEAVNDHYAIFSTGSLTRDQGTFAVYTVSGPR